jgi:hypothetical protein
MQVVSQEVSTPWPSMTIVNTKERTLRPLFIRSIGWLKYVQNDGYSILIVCSDDALVSISCISYYDSISANWTLCRFMIRNDNFMSRLQGHFHHLPSLLCILWTLLVLGKIRLYRWIKFLIYFRSRELWYLLRLLFLWLPFNRFLITSTWDLGIIHLILSMLI